MLSIAVFCAVVVFANLIMYVLARRLHRVYPEISVRRHYWRLSLAHSPYLFYLVEGKSPKDMGPVFMSHAWIALMTALGCVAFLIFLASNV